ATPTAATPTAEPRSSTQEPPPASRSTIHVVVRGESLWSIAADALGTSATDADIAAAWPELYADNRDVVGADPHLILPGQRLELRAWPAGSAR
ncbi:LysM peptidoglycan-binding domain-containing protein, partial [Demequina sp.]|uniref:LysM peptidoglycan-binding domain-containing protein n=1 Tax=Demequina sp. TaxID=2050685 RepID=UPI0025D7350F